MKKLILTIPFLLQTITQCATQQLEITVNANPSTGYSWQYSCNPKDGATIKKIKQGTKNSRQKKSDKPLVGAPTQEMYQVTKKGKNPVTCSFAYSRPWEKDTPPAQQFSIKL